MTERGFETRPQDLPDSLPIFPLPGVLLLPRGRLPLNVFEPRYLAMTEDAIASDRLIGIIQPSVERPEGAEPPIYRTGCVGRITSFAEEDHRYLITLTGICRFDVIEDHLTPGGYRRVTPDWSPYRQDFHETPDGTADRARLIAGLKVFFRRQGIKADWDTVSGTPDERLVTSLAMICPFGPAEKQTLLQARDAAERARLLTGLIEMAILDPSSEDDGARPRAN
ncbi:MAG TPA: LON peptidase substrate-binding domain-containing protein [Aliidongia sp.]|uniref:LON peptidase substrate-binding domain-containing protein n=1 Tax=Aliidongia sp. TaxID=1914230 RepID=UPI002DDD545D|nr:LON peptidase substrate-binding domain-containing protein [Aliidongia sp.]HEV2673279.1 LON peptidase substrate-binding domain-containing protein [Aliidongia sp.]